MAGSNEEVALLYITDIYIKKFLWRDFQKFNCGYLINNQTHKLPQLWPVSFSISVDDQFKNKRHLQKFSLMLLILKIIYMTEIMSKFLQINQVIIRKVYLERYRVFQLSMYKDCISMYVYIYIYQANVQRSMSFYITIYLYIYIYTYIHFFIHLSVALRFIPQFDFYGQCCSKMEGFYKTSLTHKIPLYLYSTQW